MSAPFVSNVDLESSVILNRSHETILTDSALRFTFNFFDAKRASTGIKLVTTTKYYSLSNRQVKRFNNTFVVWRQHYVNDY